MGTFVPLFTKFVARDQMRILIAEDKHYRRLSIEKSLNFLGQYQIGTVSSFAELDQLTRLKTLVFDLVIINSDLLQNAGVDAAFFYRRNGNINNALIYGDEYLILRDVMDAERWGSLIMAKDADLPTLICVVDAIRMRG